MDQASYERAQALGLCIRCLCLFINPKYEDIFLKDKEFIRDYAMSKLSLETLHFLPEHRTCPCCMNCLAQVAHVAQVIDKKVSEAHSSTKNQSIFLHIITPPILETVRIACRTVVTTSPIKLGPFPCWDELLSRLLGKLLGGKYQISPKMESAKVKVEVVLNFHDEINLALAIDPRFEKAKKRRLPGVQLQVVDHNFSFARKDEDNLLATIKTFTKDLNLLQYLTERLHTYVTEKLPPAPSAPGGHVEVDASGGDDGGCLLLKDGCPLSWKFSVVTQPIYLIGRYRKLSREISQARWTLTEENDHCDDGSVPSSEAQSAEGFANANERNAASGRLKSVRKGKMSVEEIVCEAVNLSLKAKHSRLHPCGREDIDVRMLGNGRPFVVEVLEAREPPTEEVIGRILKHVSEGRGLNEDKDVEVLVLEETTHKTWATMQHVAEEKRKGYSCICWSAKKLTREIMEHVEGIPQTCGSVDDEGTPCLEITQKTPLRVLHRRSALTRTRHIYSMSAARLNDHYFVLNVVTSAGAYVKEFVHGDLGRTFPSISSVISAPTDILQLDVTWLYDSFVGNGNITTCSEEESEPISLSVPTDARRSIADVCSTKLYKPTEAADNETLSWRELQTMQLASFSTDHK